MPTRTYRKKRPAYRRKRRTRRFKPTANRGGALSIRAPLGQTFKFRSRYIELDLGLDPTTGGVAALHVFRMNSMYSPNVTTTGHQPMGFDEMMAFYDHYTVIGSKARISFQNTDTSYCQTVYTQLKDSITTTANTVGLLENGACKYTTLSPHGSGGAIKTMTVPCSVARFFGKKSVLEDVTFRGDVSSNAGEEVYLHVGAQSPAGIDTSKVRFTIEIDYIAILTEPKQLAQS